MTIKAMVEECITSGVVLTVLDDGRLRFTGKTKLPIAQQLFEVAREDRDAVIAALHAVMNPPVVDAGDTEFAVPMTEGEGFPDLLTADLYSLYDYWLTAEELATVRQRYPGLTIEARQDGDRFAITWSYAAGAKLWQGKAGIYVIG